MENRFNTNDAIKIIKQPNYQKSFRGLAGFISRPLLIPENTYEICVLDDAGSLIDCIEVSGNCLQIDKTETTKKIVDIYRKTVDSIAFEANDRAKKYRLVQKFLAYKYKISQDEVYAIYKAMLCYEDFFLSIEID